MRDVLLSSDYTLRNLEGRREPGGREGREGRRKAEREGEREGGGKEGGRVEG